MTAVAAIDGGEFWLPDCYETKPVDGVTSGGFWREELSTSVNEFQFEFGRLMMKVSSPVGVDSSLGSEESDEDEFFAGLTQRLISSDSRSVSCLDLNQSHKGLKVSGGSPQSILGGLGSWSDRSSNRSNHHSPPSTPFESEDNTLGLIYGATGQVSRLQRSVDDPLQASPNRHWRAVAKPKPHQYQNADFYTDLQMKQKYIASARQVDDAALFWEHHLQNMKRSVTHSYSKYGASSEVLSNYQAIPLHRKESAGTGVFIPRRYDNSSRSMSSRRTSMAPCALVPAKVVQALNVSIETLRASLPHNNSIRSSGGLIQQNYDVLMARRRAALLDQQLSSRSPEARLPQEWIY